MLQHLRKLKYSLGRALFGVLVLAWLGAALQPCLMTGSPATHHMSGEHMAEHAPGHDCCPPAPGKQAPQPSCSAQSCAMQSLDQQPTDLLTLTRLGSVFVFALLLVMAWPRLTSVTRNFILPRVPPPHPHPTLAYCTLLI